MLKYNGPTVQSPVVAIYKYKYYRISPQVHFEILDAYNNLDIYIMYCISSKPYHLFDQ